MRAAEVAIALTVILAAHAGCGPDEARVPGIQTRVFVDRTQAHVGDPIGVTIEIEVPEGFRVERPAPPPPDERFLTDSLEPVEPEIVAGGVRHRLLWTLRARSVGEHRMPFVDVPLVFPDGRTEPVSIGGVPLPIRSVRDELPEQTTYFDIRPPPAPRWSTGALILAGTGAALALALGVAVLVARRRRASEVPVPTEQTLAEACVRAIESALSETEPRALAATVGVALLAYAQARFGAGTESSVVDELEGELDEPLYQLLRRLEHLRFGRVCERETVLALVRSARDDMTLRASSSRGPARVAAA